jgi:hypothetical protein
MTSTILLLAVSCALIGATAAECVSCSTRGVTSFFDGCNQCSCNANSTSGGAPTTTCTLKACEPNVDPNVCTGKCDGFTVPSDDGCGTCKCKNGRVDLTQCFPRSGKCDSPCTTVTCAPGKQCQASPKQCITTPCPQFACVGPCDANPCAQGETCVDEPKQCITTPCPQYRCIANNNCFDCNTPGVQQFFDGCNQCQCINGGASCTKRACPPVVHDEKQCVGQCDGFLTEDDGTCGRCTCVGGEKTRCSKCGVGSTCKTVEGKSQCVAVVPPQKACDARPCAQGETCVEDPKQCVTTPCPQYRCDKTACASKPCADNETCVEEPKQCFTTPCPQYRCDKLPTNTCFDCKTQGVKSYYDGCNQCTCQADGTASCTERFCAAVFRDPKQCVGHCDGFLTEDDGTCGRCTCVGGEKTRCSKCGVGSTCKTNADGKSQCVAVVPPQKACDAKPCADGETCVEDPKQCLTLPCPQYRCEKTTCALKPCPSYQSCVDEPKQCLTTPCPQYRCEDLPYSYRCFDCKTPGVKSYFDGCNQCSCQADGSELCTKRFCPELFRDPKQCAGHCDGFQTSEDGVCGSCQCVGGEKTRCTKCGAGSTCKTNADGKSECVAVVPPQKVCTAKSCNGGEVCVEDPKQCITTPCPQFRCEKITCAVKPCHDDEKCVDGPTQCITPPCPEFRCEPQGKCFDCKMPGVKSYFDGCNQCTCQADGTASCTELACIALFQDPKQCAGHCDGFLTEEDGTCGRCTCVGGQKTRCSKCEVGLTCKTVEGKSQCAAVDPPQTCTVCSSDAVCRNADVPKGDECNTCKCIDGKKVQCTSRPCSAQCKGVTQCAGSGRICIAEPKQCLTSPCDQFTCAEIGSEAALKDAKLAAVDTTDGAAQLSAMVAIVVAIVASLF